MFSNNNSRHIPWIYILSNFQEHAVNLEQKDHKCVNLGLLNYFPFPSFYHAFTHSGNSILFLAVGS